MAGAEIVQNDGLAPGLGQQFTSVASDVTGAAGYQNRTWQDVLTMPQFQIVTITTVDTIFR